MAKKRERSRGKGAGTLFKISREVEGLLLIAGGLLILVSLSARVARGADNLLGPYLGVWLSDTLVSIAGPLPAYIIPFILFTLGWKALRGEKAPTSLRKMVFFGLLFLEMCALLGINFVREVPAPGMLLGGGGLIGEKIASWVFIPLFGHRAFGPYFVSFFGIIITIVWGARVSIAQLLNAFDFLVELFGDIRDEVFKRWSPGYENTKRSMARQKKLLKGTLAPVLGDEKIRETEQERQQNARQRLEEKQQEFLREKGNLAPQIVESTDEEPAEPDAEEESHAEKRQRKQAELEAGDVTGETEEQALDAAAKENKVEEEQEKKEQGMSEPSTRSIPVIAGMAVKKKENVVYDEYNFPSLDLLNEPPPLSELISKEELIENSRVLEEKLKDFQVEGKVVNVYPGPVITRYEVELAPGIKVSRVSNLSDDIAMAMKALRVRILAPIPGKGTIGVELPNARSATILVREILASDKFMGTRSEGLPIAIAKTITGEPYVADLTRMPHLLVAGQTGSGKSVCVNCIITSILYSKAPEDCRMLMIDPKRVELALYNDIPHLYYPVVNETRDAVKCLKWCVGEMERRYKLLAKASVRNIAGFNEKVNKKLITPGALSDEENQKMPFIVLLVDELADLMMVAANEVETSIVRLAQLARAVGIHLVIATQRPSTNVITGLIKANMPSRIAFQVAAQIDSRVILDQKGAEKLLGRGDMLFIPPGVSDLVRLHGAFISDAETERVVEAVRTQKVKADRLDNWGIADEPAPGEEGDEDGEGTGTDAELFYEAARLVVNHQLGSTSLIQRRLKLGYARAGRLMDDLEAAGIVGPNNGSKAREVLIDMQQLEEILKDRK